jgi:hypothetical protein
MQHPLLKCLLRQKNKPSSPDVKQLPMGVSVEIGRTLDVETRKNLMLANKLMMDAFSKEDRAETKAEYASYMLAKTWKTLFETAAKSEYSLYFRFEQQRTYVDVEIQCNNNKLSIVLTVNANYRATLQKALPKAEMRMTLDGRNDKWNIYLNITYDSSYENNRGKNNIATPSTVVNAINRITYGMEMLPPSAYKYSSFRFTLFSRYTNKTSRLKPIFEKLSIYHAETRPPTQNAQNVQNVQNVQNTQRVQPAKYLTTSQAIQAARNGTIMQMIHNLPKKSR